MIVSMLRVVWRRLRFVMVQVSVSARIACLLVSSRTLKNTSSSVGELPGERAGSIPLSLSRMNMPAMSATEPSVATISLDVHPG
jgi:hypothetical protein